ncbi:hypothetical protein [Oleiagrimonas soli]|uniref:Putative membrane protein n=1 Tax=Oleiagrimonas soli TaxID=1543381 RepID=A0A099CYT8_9GAMM|nr:hypothetical protein [Oleiagrimonas soli]KGI78836.1 hypothetical protein LF63_0102555 [Oleiagrimonas soli]MBB6184374.1 putative membrane protein [Oleiagrimonas soli]
MKNGYALFSGTLFALVALLQAVRAIQGWSVQIGQVHIPVWFSWIAVAVAGGMSVWAWRSR